MKIDPETPPLLPWDEHNTILVHNVRPPDWVNPEPAARYNLVVIGGGTAGLVTAVGAAGLGAKVALVERRLLGGDCLNVGCVPSKALIRSARAVVEVRRAGEFGIALGAEITVDFPRIMERMRRLRAEISPHDSASRLRELGIDVFLASARFSGPDTIEAGDRTLRFAKAVIATGARAAIPEIPGIERVRYLTNESLFSLSELPKRFGVIGAGPIGCELAQAFARFGSEVSLIETEHGVLPKEDRDAANLIRDALSRDGVKLLCCAKKLHVAEGSQGIRLRLESHGQGQDLVVDQLLVATGRTPNVENLGLERVGVECDKKGIEVDETLRTANPCIYACGDVCSAHQFTHAADFMARIVIQNALFKRQKRFGDWVVPWCTYTSPEIAHVGLYQNEARQNGIEIDTFQQDFSRVDRTVVDGAAEGFVRVHVRKGTDQILGATIVAENAGDLISELSLAMAAKLGLNTVGNAIHPYPTRAEAIRKCGDLYNRTRLTPFVKTLFEKWLAWQRA